MSVRVLFPVCLLLVALQRSVALKCYQCVNLKSDSSLISSNLNPLCEDVDSSTGSVTCDSYDSCVYADVTATVKTLFGDTKITMQYRGCSGGIVSAGCHSASTNDLKGTEGKLVKALAPEISGKVCYCDSDLCDPRCDGVMIGDNCYAVWVVAILAIGSIVLVVGFCVLLCKCCNRGSRGTVIQTAPIVIAGQPTVIQTMPATYPVQGAQVITTYPAQGAQMITTNPMQGAQMITTYPAQGAQMQGGIENPGYQVLK